MSKSWHLEIRESGSDWERMDPIHSYTKRETAEERAQGYGELYPNTEYRVMPDDQLIEIKETVISKGQHAGEEGVRLSLILPEDRPAPSLSDVTRGYYEGSEHIELCYLAGGYEIAANQLGTASIYDDNGNYITDDAEVAVDMGIIRRIANEYIA
ncbi:MAG: hypothetical protein PHR16_17580 [Methylovulum sp.]|jgi:hypothetical protein|nr:hypothetical protein [Methylovulum sp.]